MRSKFYFAFLLFEFLFLQQNFAQTDSVRNSNEEIIQNLLQESEDETNNEGLIDNLEELNENPVDINTARISKLQLLPGIDFSLAQKIIDHREKYGRYFSKNELITVEGLSEETIKNIFPFITTGFPTYERKNKKVRSGNLIKIITRSRAIRNLQDNAGILENKFAGNIYKTYSRTKIRFMDRIEAGILIDKDAGESSYNDLTTAHISFSDFGNFQKLILGDYQVEFGQGLAIWSPYSFSKSTNAIYPVKKKAKNISGYNSSDENRFLRGGAAKVQVSDLSFTAFYSKNKFDANIDTVNFYIISTPVDGLHRTSGEIDKKNRAEESLYGGILNYNKGKINLGLLYYHSDFDKKFYSPDRISPEGNSFNFYSISYDIYYKNFNLFGESAFNSKSVASIINLQVAFTNSFTFITSVRNYPGNYFNLHSNGFAEQSGKTQNEFGIYNGIRWRTPIGLFNFYYDQFRFPRPTYNVPLPSNGNEFLLAYEVHPLNRLKLNFKFKNEEKDISAAKEGNIGIFKRDKTSFRIEFRYSVNRNLELRNRFEFNNYRVVNLDENETGYLLFQDIRFRPFDNLSMYGRIIFFQTDSFNTAVYEFENDLDGVFSITGLSGKGTRWYAIVKYAPLNFLKFSMKYSETYKPFVNSIGSGYSEINGNLQSRVSLQIDVNL